MLEHLWIFGIPCGAGIVNPRIGFAIALPCLVIFQLWDKLFAS